MSSEEEEGEEEKRRWRCALVKDLTTTGRAGLTRRHSVTLCSNKTSFPAVDQLSKSPKKASKQPPPVKEETPPALATLDLNLEEVAHIRSVLTRAELDALPLDTGVKEAVEGGRLCFLCLTTRFGLFTRGTKCQVIVSYLFMNQKLSRNMKCNNQLYDIGVPSDGLHKV